MSQTNITVEIHEGQPGLEGILSDWVELAKRYGTHFLHYPAWYQARFAGYPSEKRCFFLTLSDQEGLAAVIPFEQDAINVGPINVPALILSYPNEMGVCDGLSRVDLSACLDEINTALSQISYRFYFIKFNCVPESASVIQSNFASLDGLAKQSHDTKFLDVSSGREKFYEAYSSKFKRNLRRKIKKANEVGQLRLSRIQADHDDIERAFNKFIEIENSGWKGEGGTSIAQQKDKLAYYTELYKQYRAQGILNINLLYLDDNCIAAQFGLEINQTLYLLKIAYNQEYSDISPGHLLLDELITEGQDQGKLKKISFVTGVGWIDRWKPSAEKVWVVYYSRFAIVRFLMKFYLSRR